MQLPAKQSLIVQTANALRHGIKTGVWRVGMPGERELAQMLKVSRPTVRAALYVLERERLVARPVSGCRRKIMQPARAGRTRISGKVVLLCDAPPQLANSRVRHVIDALRDALQKHAVIMETRLYPRATAGLDRKLQALTDRLSPAAWVLTRSSLAVQEWFARHDLPVLVNGTAYPDMSLPAFGTDFYAVGRHAAGLFIARGYRRLIMLAAHQQPAGDMEAARGFEAGIKSSTDGVAADHQILRFEGDRNAFRAQLDELLHGCKPPLAFFCAYAAQALALLCHARGLGYAIPRDIGLIARVDDPLLEWTIPAIACYRIDITLYVRRLARLIMQLVRDGALPPKAFCIVPEFFPGESVAASGGRPVVSSP